MQKQRYKGLIMKKEIKTTKLSMNNGEFEFELPGELSAKEIYDLFKKDNPDIPSEIISPDWYYIENKWYHCQTIEGKRYVNGKLQ